MKYEGLYNKSSNHLIQKNGLWESKYLFNHFNDVRYESGANAYLTKAFRSVFSRLFFFAWSIIVYYNKLVSSISCWLCLGVMSWCVHSWTRFIDTRVNFYKKAFYQIKDTHGQKSNACPQPSYVKVSIPRETWNYIFRNIHITIH